jgi:MerR family copper efflux transcriptional regulator
VDTLRFIRRARDFGLPMDRVKLLVGLWQDASRPSREVKKLAMEQVAELEAKIGELTAMKDSLTDLVRRCRGDSRPDCPILRDLAGSAATVQHAGLSSRPRTGGLRAGTGS